MSVQRSRQSPDESPNRESVSEAGLLEAKGTRRQPPATGERRACERRGGGGALPLAASRAVNREHGISYEGTEVENCAESQKNDRSRTPQPKAARGRKATVESTEIVLAGPENLG